MVSLHSISGTHGHNFPIVWPNFVQFAKCGYRRSLYFNFLILSENDFFFIFQSQSAQRLEKREIQDTRTDGAQKSDNSDSVKTVFQDGVPSEYEPKTVEAKTGPGKIFFEGKV